MAEQSTTSTGPGSECDCECESSSPTASDSGPSADVQSFVNRFRSPRLSELTRKCTIRITNGTRKRKAKPSCCTDPKSVTPMQRVRDFPNEELAVSAGKLFCSACREELSLKLKLSIIKLHIKSSKHIVGKGALVQREARERDITQALQAYDQQEHPSGETLPESQRVYRVKVVTSFLKAGVPLNKLHHFREILEQHVYKLGDQRGMYDLIPFVFYEEQKRIKTEIQGTQLYLTVQQDSVRHLL